MDGYMAEVKMFGGNYPPQNWAYCQGQVMSIQQNQALYSIMGITFGGNGTTNFQLPDLRGRVAVGAGTGPGLTTRVIGQYGGFESIQLSPAHLPPHTHSVYCDMTTTTGRGYSETPEGNLPGIDAGGNSYGSDFSGGHKMNQDMISSTGSSYPFSVMQPWLCLNYIICVMGTYPPRS